MPVRALPPGRKLLKPEIERRIEDDHTDVNSEGPVSVHVLRVRKPFVCREGGGVRDPIILWFVVDLRPVPDALRDAAQAAAGHRGVGRRVRFVPGNSPGEELPKRPQITR